MSDTVKGAIFLIGMAPVAWYVLERAGDDNIRLGKTEVAVAVWAAFLVIVVSL